MVEDKQDMEYAERLIAGLWDAVHRLNDKVRELETVLGRVRDDGVKNRSRIDSTERMVSALEYNMTNEEPECPRCHRKFMRPVDGGVGVQDMYECAWCGHQVERD